MPRYCRKCKERKSKDSKSLCSSCRSSISSKSEESKNSNDESSSDSSIIRVKEIKPIKKVKSEVSSSDSEEKCYDKNLININESLSDFTKCYICLNFSKEPIICRYCGNLACKKCLDKWKKITINAEYVEKLFRKMK